MTPEQKKILANPQRYVVVSKQELEDLYRFVENNGDASELDMSTVPEFLPLMQEAWDAAKDIEIGFYKGELDVTHKYGSLKIFQNSLQPKP